MDNTSENFQKLSAAQRNGVPVRFVYNAKSTGEDTARFGTVRSVTKEHVQINDMFRRGVRTCLLERIRSLELEG